ncbi:MXAN_6230/SCO0854 family RING domain-containing protein [Actinoplanes sp. CA-142083]|uniref:MXAN_6230/SCO0854 family RING domain-containing protein n=1 Tax=Actinoplanes sp. CA-142083 TaxID=3239903 RepID=UPI003D8AB73B
MDTLAAVLFRCTGRVTVVGTGSPPPDGPAWVAALEADLAERGWLMRSDLRAAAARLSPAVRVRWADWLLATVDELSGADRPMLPLYRAFPDTPRDVEAVYVRRLLAHLFAVPGAPCVLCGREEGGEPLDPCGHVVCPACFPPEQFTGCPVCGRRLSAANTYLTIVEPPARGPLRTDPPEVPMRLAGLETAPVTAGAQLRDQLVARPHALSETDRDNLRALVAATAPGRLDWLPPVVPARETLALLIADALHAAALTPSYPQVVDSARAHWSTVTDAARTLWSYSGGDPGLVLPRRESDDPAPGDQWRPHEEPRVTVPVPRVRALPRPLRRAVLAHIDACGAALAAEELRRHVTVWKRLGERLHPYEWTHTFPEAAVAFAALRGTRTARSGPLGAAMVAACARSPRHLLVESCPGDRIGVRLRTHASLVEHAFEQRDAAGAAQLLTERPGDFWRRLDHLLRAAGDDPEALSAIAAAARQSAARVAPGVLAAASAELAGRAETAQATPAQLAATARARAAAQARKSGPFEPAAFTSSLGAALERVRGIASPPAREGHPPAPTPPARLEPSREGHAHASDEPGDGGHGIVGGRPGPGMPRRVFFPRGSVVTTWTEPERRSPLPPEAIREMRELVDHELSGRAGRLERFDVAVIDAALAEAPAPMRERAGSAQLAGWPRGSVRRLPEVEVLRLFLHWEEPAKTRVDLDLSCAFFGEQWERAGHCDYTQLRFAGDAAVHSGDFTSAPAPLGATEFLDLDLGLLAAEGVRFLVPMVLSFNAVPFELLTEAFAGLMLPSRHDGRFDADRVAQRYDLHGNARMHLPMVIDLRTRRLLWTDLMLNGRGYGHSVDRHGDQLARAAADQWEHFLGGHRPTLFDLMAWHAAGRADRVLIAHPDGAYTEVAPDVSAIRAAASAPEAPRAAGAADDRPTAPDLADLRVLAGAADVGRLDGLKPAPGSVALTVTGLPGDPWTPMHPSDLLGYLAP